MLDNDSTVKEWYLVYTKPNLERVAKENLNHQGYTTYLPLAQTTRRRRGRYVSCIEPLFPRYLFTHLDCVTDNWAPIRSTIGVSNIVRFGMMPAKLPVELISKLQENEDEMGVQFLPSEEFCKGDRVRIIDGMLSGYEAVFEGKVGSERVAILLDIADKHTKVVLTRHNIRYA